jgi:zinc transport system permease protein
MAEFIRALTNPAIPFLRYALYAGLISSAAFGVIGTYVVVKRISYIAGAISHSVLAGIGASLYVRHHFGILWITPLIGSLIAGLIAALILGLVSIYAKEREDTVIGAIWSVGMATGLLLMASTPSYVEPMNYLFGNILLLTRNDLLFIGILDGIVILVGILFYHPFQAMSFDQEFALVRGAPVAVYYMILLALTAVAIVLLATMVGLVMVIALLTLPAAVAGMFSRRLWQMMILACLITMFFTSGGLAVSYIHDLPSGSTIIMFAGIAYILAATGRSLYDAIHDRTRVPDTTPDNS